MQYNHDLALNIHHTSTASAFDDRLVLDAVPAALANGDACPGRAETNVEIAVELCRSSFKDSSLERTGSKAL